VTPCILVEIYQRFRGTFYVLLQDRKVKKANSKHKRGDICPQLVSEFFRKKKPQENNGWKENKRKNMGITIF
jgi:hypothetical protein